MKIEDRRRQSVAISELAQALTLTKLASRSLIDLYERHPKHRASLKHDIGVYHRWFSEEWDTLVGISDLDERRKYVIPTDAKPTSQEVVERFMKLVELHDVAVTMAQRLVREHPEMLPWGADLVTALWTSVNTVRQSFARTQITIRHQERLAKLGKPDPVGVERGEPTRPIEPPLRTDAEYAAWEAANPADAILPPSGPEDFVVKHPDGTVTRLRDLAPAYEAGLIDRPWAPLTRNWELDLVHDLILARACASDIRRVSDSHLNWWLKPLKAMVRTLEPDALLETAKGQLKAMMSAHPMLITEFGNDRGGGWIPTHGGTSRAHPVAAGLSDAAGRDGPSSADFPLGDGFSLTKHLEDVQRRFLARAMQEAGGKKTVAAKLLGYPNYQTLAAQLVRLKVDWGDE